MKMKRTLIFTVTVCLFCLGFEVRTSSRFSRVRITVHPQKG